MKHPIIVKKEKIIDFPVKRVWEFIEPAAHIAIWYPDAVYSEKISGDGIGRKQLLFLKWGKKEVEIVQELVDYQVNSLIRWKHIRETFDGKETLSRTTENYFSILLADKGDKTLLSLQSEIIPGRGWKTFQIKLLKKPHLEKSLNSSILKIENGIRSPQLPKTTLMDALL
jgi:hypothetical protein